MQEIHQFIVWFGWALNWLFPPPRLHHKQLQNLQIYWYRRFEFCPDSLVHQATQSSSLRIFRVEPNFWTRQRLDVSVWWTHRELSCSSITLRTQQAANHGPRWAEAGTDLSWSWDGCPERSIKESVISVVPERCYTSRNQSHQSSVLCTRRERWQKEKKCESISVL